MLALVFLTTFILHSQCTRDYSTYKYDDTALEAIAVKPLVKVTASLALALGSSGVVHGDAVSRSLAFHAPHFVNLRPPIHITSPAERVDGRRVARAGWGLDQFTSSDQTACMFTQKFIAKRATTIHMKSEGIDINHEAGIFKKANKLTHIVADFMGDMCMYSVLSELSIQHPKQFGSYGFISPTRWMKSGQMLMRPYADSKDHKTKWPPLVRGDKEPHSVFVYERPLFDDSHIMKYKSVDNKFVAAPQLAEFTLGEDHVRQFAVVALVDMLLQNTDRLAWPGCTQLHRKFNIMNPSNVMWHVESDGRIELLPIDNGYNCKQLQLKNMFKDVAARKIRQYCANLRGWSHGFLQINKSLFRSMQKSDKFTSDANVELFMNVWLEHGDQIADIVEKMSEKYNVQWIERTMNAGAGDLFADDETENKDQLNEVALMIDTVESNVEAFKSSIQKYRNKQA